MDKYMIRIKRRFNRDTLFTDALVFVTLMVNLLSMGSTLVIYLGGTFSQALLLYFTGIPAVLIFFFRRLTFSLPVRFVCYASFAVIAVLFGLSGGPIVSFASSLIILVAILLSFSRHYRTQFSITIPFEMLLFILVNHIFMLISASVFNSKKLLLQLFIHAICSICLFFAARQYHVFTTQYARLALSPTQPSAIVKNNHMKTILSLTLFGLVGAPLILTLPYDKISRLIIIISRKALEIFVSLMYFFRDIGLFLEPDDVLELQEVSEKGAPENKLLASILENIFTLIAIVLLSLIVVATIRGIAVFIVKMHLRGKPSERPISENIIRDHVDKISKRNRLKRHRLDFGIGDERKIRREFYLQVKKAIRDGALIQKSDTPAEMRAKMTNQDEKSLDALIEAYEKTRYSIN